jgi:hypothetical protein
MKICTSIKWTSRPVWYVWLQRMHLEIINKYNKPFYSCYCIAIMATDNCVPLSTLVHYLFSHWPSSSAESLHFLSWHKLQIIVCWNRLNKGGILYSLNKGWELIDKYAYSKIWYEYQFLSILYQNIKISILFLKLVGIIVYSCFKTKQSIENANQVGDKIYHKIQIPFCSVVRPLSLC